MANRQRRPQIPIKPIKNRWCKHKCQASVKYVHLYVLKTCLGLLFHELMSQCVNQPLCHVMEPQIVEPSALLVLVSVIFFLINFLWGWGQGSLLANQQCLSVCFSFLWGLFFFYLAQNIFLIISFLMWMSLTTSVSSGQNFTLNVKCKAGECWCIEMTQFIMSVYSNACQNAKRETEKK